MGYITSKKAIEDHRRLKSCWSEESSLTEFEDIKITTLREV